MCFLSNERYAHFLMEVGISLWITPSCATAFQKVSNDLPGPVPWFHDRSRYMVVVVDLYSKYAFIGRLRSKGENEVARWFNRSVMLTYSMPKSVVSNLGAKFCNRASKRALAIMEIEYIRTTLYHLQSKQRLKDITNQQNGSFRNTWPQTTKTGRISYPSPLLLIIRRFMILPKVTVFHAVPKRTDYAWQFGALILSLTPSSRRIYIRKWKK